MTKRAARENDFLPTTRAEMEQRGWAGLDILLVTGDAYVDHPAFGAALIGRWLASQGYRVGIVAQPRWDTADDMARMGRPRLFAGVTAGALDSMLAHYTAFRKKRHDDAYTPGGRHGARPNRASIAYTGRVRQAFPGLPVVLGGIEASLRRASHYDFWADGLRRSILLDSKADCIAYGMGERTILMIAQRVEAALEENEKPDWARALWGIPGTALAAPREGCPELPDPCLSLPSHEAIEKNPRLLVKAAQMMERQIHEGSSWMVQETGPRRLVFTPPAEPLTASEMDALYALPFSCRPHPGYRDPIPALETVQFSITSHRGCGGGCSFCSLALHQGRRIQSRSEASLRGEVERLTGDPAWRGSITDVGGPSANMWGARCASPKPCRRPSCLAPTICRHFRPNQARQARMLEGLAKAPGVKHLRISSGIRFDLALQEEPFIRSLVRHFVGGQLKLAPEHASGHVLRAMRKADFASFETFLELFDRESRRCGKAQYVIPYLMSAFPGCTDDDMRGLARWLKRRGWRPQQVQCFIPTPGTVASAMFWARTDEGGRPIHVARTDAERLRQHRILIPEPARTPRKPAKPKRRRARK